MRSKPLPISIALTVLAAFLSAGPSGAQVFSSTPSQIPSGSNNNSYSENIDFGDVDLDGDWDAVFADGGDQGNDQNRIWINRGGLQGGTIGFFDDATNARFPSVQDDSRDIEFVDIENDGDLDIYTSNTAQLSQQSNRWWVNQGLLQAGSLGYYQDDTAARWVGLDSAGTSIPSGAILGGGGFIDWSCDCDFGDLDNDGDLDLVHSSYGGAFNGNVPTRIFLNDGTGHFSEYNPSGFRLTSNNIANGNPGLWCEGNQSANTSNTSGSSCDIASSALDIDVGDIDGDFDLDILHGARQELPRMFRNNLAENNWATRGFRDVTGNTSGSGVFPSQYSDGDGHYEQEMGDFDNDGDLDIYGLNWRSGGFGFEDVTMKNDGTGKFNSLVLLSGSDSDDNEGDFVDYDNDGDLDLYVANFSGTDRLYSNNGTGTFTLLSTNAAGLTSTNASSLDADAADVDKDGDYDVFVAMDGGVANLFLKNITQTADTHDPRVSKLEALSNQAATGGERVVRAHVYDNAPYYITWYNPTYLEVSVGGVDLPDQRMASSGGQIFRGTIAANLVGTISYRVRSSDEYGNTGTSITRNYTASGGPVGTVFGSATAGSLGNPVLEALSLPLPGNRLYLNATNVPSGTVAFLALSISQKSTPQDLSNGLLLNIGLPFVLLRALVADSNGDAVTAIDVPAGISGLSLYAQAFAFDGVSGNDFASTRGLRVDVP